MNFKMQSTAFDIVSELTSRLASTGLTVAYTETGTAPDDYPVITVGTSGTAGAGGLTIQIKDQKTGTSTDSLFDNIVAANQSVFTTGVAIVGVESTGAVATALGYATIQLDDATPIVANDTITFVVPNGTTEITFTFKVTPASNVEVALGASQAAAMANFAAAVRAHPTLGPLFTAQYVNDTTDYVTITAKTPGTEYNQWGIEVIGGGLTIAAAAFAYFAGGTGKAVATCAGNTIIAGNTITLAGNVFTCSAGAPANENQFRVGASDYATLVNFAAAVNAHSTHGKLFTAIATDAGATATNFVARAAIFAKQNGTYGNAYAITDSGATIDTVTFAGGAGAQPGSTYCPGNVLMTVLAECVARGLRTELWMTANGTAPTAANVVASGVYQTGYEGLLQWAPSGRV